MSGPATLFGALRDGARLMVGLPSYDAYREHMLLHHPEQEPMREAAFIAERQAAHYGEGRRGGFRCC